MKKSSRLTLSAIALFTGCGSGLHSGPGISTNLQNTLSGVSLALTAFYEGLNWKELVFLNQNYFFNTTYNSEEASLTSFKTGEATPDQLKSLKYYITKVELCESLETSGTAWNNPKNCMVVFTNPNFSQSKYDSFDAVAARADTSSNYIDLINASAAKAALNKSVSVTPGSYNFAIVSIMKPIKLNAEVTLWDGTNLVTKDPSGDTGVVDSLIGPAGTSQEAVVSMQNGGTWARFPQPYVIPESDVRSGVSYVLDISFNPGNLIKGGTGASNAGLHDAAFNGIYVPVIGIGPVVHKSTETVTKETYLLTSPNIPQFDIRAELYYITQDATKSVYGYEFTNIYKGSATVENIMNFYKPFFVVKNSDNTLTFQDYQKGTQYANFHRLTQLNTTGTVDFVCPGTGMVGNACTSGQTISLTSTLTAITEIK